MRPALPDDVQRRLKHVSDLSQWERAELGRSLRRLGWTYTEIGAVVPAAKSTIAGWCRGIELSPGQIDAIARRTDTKAGIPRDTQWRRHAERAAIIEAARAEAKCRTADPEWVAGVMLYWGEGFKTENALGLANSDADLMRLFMHWSRTHLDSRMEFRAKLNLHAGNDETTATIYWARALSIPTEHFNKTFIKPEGTGHRRNHLEHGVIQVRARRSTDHFLRTMGWIEGLRSVWMSQQNYD